MFASRKKLCNDNFLRDHHPSVNWRLETVVRQVQHFFQVTMRDREDLGSFVVHQRNDWCPYSIWSSFFSCINDGFTTVVGDIFNNQMIEERLRQTADYANRELYPKRSPKMRAKILWELHCLWNERLR